VHSGDSACATPPHTLAQELTARIEDACTRIALALDVKGLMNVQIAVKDDDFYILEINPRASRTVPYISKATGVPLAKVATRAIMGEALADMGLPAKRRDVAWSAVKEAVFPFDRFAGVDPILGPEMKSTGEVMGIDSFFEPAYWKSQVAAGQRIPSSGTVFLSAKDRDKDWIAEMGVELAELGFDIVATSGTAERLEEAGVKAQVLKKLAEGGSPNVLDLMHENKLAMLINTPSGPVSRVDETHIRSEAILRSVPIVTTESGARATVSAIRYMRDHDWDVRAIQDYHRDDTPPGA
jgi:carbamoyl-phosphate synthase large subunit